MKSLVAGASALARIGGAWELSSYDHEATSSTLLIGSMARHSDDDPAACAGPATGEGLLGGLDDCASNRAEIYERLTKIRLIGGGHDPRAG